MIKILLLGLLFSHVSFPAEPASSGSNEKREQDVVGGNVLGRIGQDGYPTHPQYDRAKGYL